jgi:hypothetical protein
MLKLIGRIITNNKGTKLLVIHSKRLSEEIYRIRNNVSLENFLDGLKIEPGGKIHVTVASKKRLQIAVTTLIKDKKIKIRNNTIPIYLDENSWKINKKEILAKSVGNPISDIIPGNLVTKRAAIRPNKEKFYLDISSKKLYDISKNNMIKCLFNRIGDSMLIINSENVEARRLTPHSKKRIQISIPKKLLKEKEIEDIKKNGWLPINLKLNLESFGLKISDFYSVKEEHELVEYLIDKKIKIKIKEPADPYDILIKGKGVAIEVHNSIPKYGDLVTRHKIKPGMIRLRILEADFLTKNKELTEFYLIFNEEWKNGRYIQELINKVSKKVKIFFTDFKDKWYEKVGNEIAISLSDYSVHEPY